MAPGALVKESVSHTFLISGIWTNETNRPDRWKDHPSGGGGSLCFLVRFCSGQTERSERELLGLNWWTMLLSFFSSGGAGFMNFRSLLCLHFNFSQMC